MGADLLNSMAISGAGMNAQSMRMKAAAENIANADSVQSADGSGPYRAKQVYFKTVLDKHTGMASVEATTKSDTKTPLEAVYDPGSDLANAQGFVMHPNVNVTIENLNMHEAQRSYEANLAAVAAAKDMAGRTLDMLR